MKSTRATPVSSAGTLSGAMPRRGFVQAWTDFWFTSVLPVGLHALRVLGGVLFLAWLLPMACQQQAFFGLGGLIDRQAHVQMSAMRAQIELALQNRLPAGEVPPDVPPGALPPVGWSLAYLCGSNATALNIFYWSSIAVLILFTLGLWTRLTGVLTWLVVISFVANPATHYDADFLLVILAFYLMVGYLLLGQWSRPLSLGERILGPRDTFVFGSLWSKSDRQDGDVGYTASGGLSATLSARKTEAEPAPSYAANLVVRLIQVHFAIIVLVSVLHKLQRGYWWGGVALFHPLHPPLETSLASIQAKRAYAQAYLFGLSLVQYLMLVWQIGLPVFAWKKSWRLILLGGGLLGWLGSFFVFRQPLFGPVFMIACLSYLTVAEWQSISNLLGHGVRRLTGLFRVEPAKKVAQARS